MSGWMDEYPSKTASIMVMYTRSLVNVSACNSTVRLCIRKQIQSFIFLNSCRQSDCGSLKADSCVCSLVYTIKTQYI